MRIVTSNIRDNPDLPRPAVRQAAAATARLGGIALFQEIGEAEDHRDIRAAMGPGWLWPLGDAVAIPIAVKAKFWQVLEHGFELMHHGKAGVTPNRYVAWLVLRRRFRGRIVKKARLIAVMNTHFVSGAWSTKHKADKEWRKMQWRVHFDKMRDRIARFIGRGISVIFGGDFNRTSVPDFFSNQRWLVQHGIDKIGYVPAPQGARVVKVGKSGHTDTTSDHDAAWVSVEAA